MSIFLCHIINLLLDNINLQGTKTPLRDPYQSQTLCSLQFMSLCLMALSVFSCGCILCLFVQVLCCSVGTDILKSRQKLAIVSPEQHFMIRTDKYKPMKISLHTKMINKNHTVTFKVEQTLVPPSEIRKIQKVYLILHSQITQPFDLWVDSWALENDNGYLQQVVPSNAASISGEVQRRAIEALASEMLILLPQIHFYLFQ